MILTINNKLKSLIVDRAARRLVALCIFFDLATWVLLLVRLAPAIKSGRLIALHYNVYLNVNNVGPAGFALVGAAVGAAIIIINFLLAAHAYESSRQNSIVILAVSAFYEFLIFLAAFFIIFINLTR
jgi:hypothetical protein